MVKTQNKTTTNYYGRSFKYVLGKKMTLRKNLRQKPHVHQRTHRYFVTLKCKKKIRQMTAYLSDAGMTSLRFHILFMTHS